MSFASFAKRVESFLSKGLFSESNKTQLGRDLDNVLFVTGNESADMDSCASAILGAYYYTLALERGKAPTLSIPFNANVVIPLINIPRADLSLRPDITFMLSTAGFSLNSVAFLDDFSPKIDQSAKTLLPTYLPTNAYSFLVDHNNLDGPTRKLFKADKVVGVFDHHVDEHSYQSANPRIVKTAGSCISVVTNYWVSQLGQTSKFDLTSGQDAVNLALLGLSPIMADTSGLKSKVEEDDTKAYDFYSNIIHEYKKYLPKDDVSMTSTPGDDSEELALAKIFTHPRKFSKFLSSKKRDISKFSGAELLRKDYKEWTRDDDKPTQRDLKVAISTLPAALSKIYEKYASAGAVSPREAFAQDIRIRAKARGVDVYVTSGTYRDAQDVFCRDMFLCPASDKMSRDDIETLVKNMTDPLDLQPPQDKRLSMYDEESNSYQFLQGHAKLSRKAVAPLLRHYVQGTPWDGI